MTDTILVINAGSSSIKFYLYDIDDAQELAPRLGGQLEGIGTSHPRLRVRDAAGDGFELARLAILNLEFARHVADSPQALSGSAKERGQAPEVVTLPGGKGVIVALSAFQLDAEKHA